MMLLPLIFSWKYIRSKNLRITSLDQSKNIDIITETNMISLSSNRVSMLSILVFVSFKITIYPPPYEKQLKIS